MPDTAEKIRNSAKLAFSIGTMGCYNLSPPVRIANKENGEIFYADAVDTGFRYNNALRRVSEDSWHDADLFELRPASFLELMRTSFGLWFTCATVWLVYCKEIRKRKRAT